MSYKEESNEYLIGMLCLLMLGKREDFAERQQEICEELAVRGIIESATALYKMIK